MSSSKFLAKLQNKMGSAVDQSLIRWLDHNARPSISERVSYPSRDELLQLVEHYENAPIFSQQLKSSSQSVIFDSSSRYGSMASSYQPTLTSYVETFASHHENLNIHFKWFRNSQHSLNPTLICLHGWQGGHFTLESKLFRVSSFLKRDIDVCLVQLPFHGKRKPRFSKTHLFPSSDVVRTNEAIGQMICDLRQIRHYLQSEGVTRIGVLGKSLGGYIAALWASLDTLDFATVLVPAVDLANLIWHHNKSNPEQLKAIRRGVDKELLGRAFAQHSPLLRAPMLETKNLSIHAARADRLTPPDQSKALESHWNVNASWFDAGHVTQNGHPNLWKSLLNQIASVAAPD